MTLPPKKRGKRRQHEDDGGPRSRESHGGEYRGEPVVTEAVVGDTVEDVK